MVEPVDLPTPSTVEIFKCVQVCPKPWSFCPRLIPSSTSDTERAPTPDAAEKADAEEPYGSNDTQTSNSSGHCTADTFRSLESLEAQKHPAGHPTPGRCVSPCGKHNICPHCCSNTLLKPDLLDDANPDLSPNTYIDVRNLGLHSPDGSFPELWANYPVSFIPFTSPLGPRDLEPSHYNCPYPGCIDPFGPCGHPDGYNGKELALHIYRHHGYGPAVERVRLDLHKRVMIVRRAQGKNGKDAPLPCCWIDSIRDLEQTTVGLVQDLEEIRQWERSLRAAISGKGEPASVTQAACNDRPALVEEKESVRAAEKDKGERRR